MLEGSSANMIFGGYKPHLTSTVCIYIYTHTLHYITLQLHHNYITLHYIYITLQLHHNYITLHYIELHYITLNYITLHYNYITITLHYITLRCITLHYITITSQLHHNYITSHHIYIYIYITYMYVKTC